MGPLMRLLLGMLLALGLAGPALAEGAVTPAHADPVWQASYWNNRNLAGEPVLQRSEASLDHNWGSGSPDAVVHADGFSARWTRYIDVPAGLYRFTAISDDGIRVFVDGQPIIDEWYTHPARTFTADIFLTGGHHLVQVEYFEDWGEAVVRMWWTPVSEQAIDRWHGEYFNNRHLAGAPALVREDAHIDFNWGTGSPGEGILADNFSVRWTRTVDFAAGTYRFRMRVDDGGRLWVNHHLLIDAWWDQGATTYTAEIYLAGGPVPVRMEYYEHTGAAVAQLAWSPATQPVMEKWHGEYFNNPDLAGEPVFVRDDAQIDFDWGWGAPAPDVNPDHFSVRWSRSLHFERGRYRFITETDDGVRLYIDGKLVIDQWRPMPRTRHTYELRLREGVHTIRMEYFEATQNAVARLWWEPVTRPERRWVVNIITCVPPQPDHYAWVKVYRLEADGSWVDMAPRGIGTVNPSGYLKIDGLPVDYYRYGAAGHPYRVEQWVDGRLVHSTGYFQQGEPEFRVRPYADNYTPWPCPPPGG